MRVVFGILYSSYMLIATRVEMFTVAARESLSYVIVYIVHIMVSLAFQFVFSNSVCHARCL